MFLPLSAQTQEQVMPPGLALRSTNSPGSDVVQGGKWLQMERKRNHPRQKLASQ